MKRLLVLGLLLVGLSPLNLHAQEFTGTVVGVVSDSSGAVLPGVLVTISGEAIQGVRSTVSESNGTYRITLLPPGTYTFVFDLEGFAKLTREEVLVRVGVTSSINVTMQLATLSDAVTVTGETPVVDLQSVARSLNYDSKLLSTLPIGARNLGGVLTTMPGIQVTAYDVGGSNMGSNTGFRTYGLSGQWNVRVDGTSTQDTASNLNLYFDYGALSEMNVSAAINSAESNVPGAAINMVVKTGSNQLRGTVHYDWQGKSLQGDNLTPELSNNGIVLSDQFNDYHDFNVNGGGPIKRDKFWWFYSFRDQAIHLRTQLQDPGGNVGAPGPPGALFTTSLQNHTIKLNYTINPENNVFFTGMTSLKKTNVNGRGPSAAFTDINSTRDQWTLTYIWRIQYNKTLGNRATIQSAVSTEDYDAPYRIHAGTLPTLRVTDLGADPQIHGSDAPFRDSSRKYQYEPVVLNLFTANHNIKTSYGLVWVDRRTIRHGPLAPYDHPDWPAGVALFTLNGAPAQFSISNTPFNFQSSMWQNYFFLQDKWQITKKLVANLGVRWDHYDSHYPEQGNDGIGPWATPTHFDARTLPAFNDWVPRLGVIYDLFGNGATALKANWGIYAEDPDITFAQNANPNQAEVVRRYTWDGTLPITPEVVARSTLLSTSGQFVPVAIDPDVHNQYVDQILFGVDQQLMKNLALTANWVRMLRHGTRVTINRAQPTSGYAPVAAIDPGPDGLRGTSDDRDWTVFERTVPPGTDNYLTNQDTGEYYDTIQLSATKRFTNGDQIVAGWDLTTRHLGDSTSLDPNTRQFDGDNRPVVKNWDWKILGTHVLPWDMTISGSLSVQKGESYARTVPFNGSLLVGRTTNLAQGNTTVTVEPLGKYYLPSVYSTTFHIDKKFPGFRPGQTVTGVFELYNIQNAGTVIGVNSSSGRTTFQGQSVPTFGRYTQNIPPRIARLGVRFNF